jgi:hypothetical protein
MFFFLIKKAFFDIWDNMFRIALLNIGFIASVAIPVLVPQLFDGVPPLKILVIAAGAVWCCIYLAAASLCLKSISDYQAFGFKEFFDALKPAVPIGLTLAGVAAVLFVVATTAIPFYTQINSILGLLFAAVIFWTIVAAALSMQFFLTIRSRLDGRILKSLKKSFIIFIDNPGFSLYVFFCSLIQLILSVFLALLMPGPAGILLFQDQALRLRLLKYDYLEENPDADRKKIPWDALLIDDRDRTGTRTLKNFIFPWKD